jgi:hypothetical protein
MVTLGPLVKCEACELVQAKVEDATEWAICWSAAIGTSAALSIGLLKSRMGMGEKLALCTSPSDLLAPSRKAACWGGSSRHRTSRKLL